MAGKTRPEGNVPPQARSKPISDEPLAADHNSPTPRLPCIGHLEKNQKMMQLGSDPFCTSQKFFVNCSIYEQEVNSVL
jgi:hypothetical protein